MTLRIELRTDSWYEAGKDDKDTWPSAHKIYLEKQKLKAALTKIQGESLEDIQHALNEVNANRELNEFSRPPYLQGDIILIATDGLPEAYLGRVVKKH